MCLAIDLKRSTAINMGLSTKKLDEFNLALVDQLKPHLSAMQLDHVLVKFTGDGWLIMTDNQDHAAPLCCLAVVMARIFGQEMSKTAGIAPDRIPALRLAVCCGRDLPVELPDGLRDFVGNSVRRTVRSAQFCNDNEILIDDTIRTWVSHDFVTEPIAWPERQAQYPEAKMEEEFVLHSLKEIKPEAAEDSDAPVYFINALAELGRLQEADELANRISDQLRSSARIMHDPSQLLERWNELLSSNLDLATVREVLADLRDAGLRPDLHTYNALIEKATDSRSESHWLQTMAQEGINPSVQTLNILIRKASDPARVERRLNRMLREGVVPDDTTLNTMIDVAPDYETALKWTHNLQAKGIHPNQSTYERLIARSMDFGSARYWLEQMMESGYEPSEKAFLRLFSHDLTGITAESLLQWYLSKPYHPTHPIKRAIAEYRRTGRIDDALRLALDYPHTDTARKTLRRFPERSLEYFRSIVSQNPSHANGAYALGISLMEFGADEEALPWLRKAYELAATGPRKERLRKFFDDLDSGRRANLMFEDR